MKLLLECEVHKSVYNASKSYGRPYLDIPSEEEVNNRCRKLPWGETIVVNYGEFSLYLPIGVKCNFAKEQLLRDINPRPCNFKLKQL